MGGVQSDVDWKFARQLHGILDLEVEPPRPTLPRADDVKLVPVQHEKVLALLVDILRRMSHYVVPVSESEIKKRPPLRTTFLRLLKKSTSSCSDPYPMLVKTLMAQSNASGSKMVCTSDMAPFRKDAFPLTFEASRLRVCRRDELR